MQRAIFSVFFSLLSKLSGSANQLGGEFPFGDIEHESNSKSKSQSQARSETSSANTHAETYDGEYSPKKFGPCFRCLILAYKFNMILLRLRLRVTYMHISNIEY